ncbi:MAG TPA: efflux RND transporter periplasmic adaptor subunit [Acidobacteriaceae bacterium]
MAIARVKRNNRIWVWVVSVLVVGGVFYTARSLTRTTLAVRAFTVTRGSLKSTLSTNGKMQPVMNYEAHAPFAGVVKTLSVHEGDRVHKGQLLLSMDDAEAQARLQTALASLDGARGNAAAIGQGGTQEERLTLSGDTARAQAELQQARQSLSTVEKLAASGAAAPSEVAAARARVSSDEASLHLLSERRTERYDTGDVTHARSTVAEAQAMVAAARETLDNAHVRAPFDGTVYSLSASLSEYVQQGDRLLQLADLSKMQVIAYFDEPDIGKLSINERVTITWVAKPDRVWHGYISRLPATVITYTTRNVGEVYCTIEDANGELLPNTNVNVTATTANVADALYVPREALHTEGGLSYVYRVVHGKLRRSKVGVGSLNLTQIQITSGLGAGDIVALGSTTMQPLVDGVAVDIVP